MNTTTNQTAISIITSTIAFMAFACVVTICLLSYWSIQIPPELNTLAGGLVGALTAMLVKTSPTETQKQPQPPPPAAPPSKDHPMPVQPITSVADPVHTEEAGK